jgi:hypothetical protein
MFGEIFQRAADRVESIVEAAGNIVDGIERAITDAGEAVANFVENVADGVQQRWDQRQERREFQAGFMDENNNLVTHGAQSVEMGESETAMAEDFLAARDEARREEMQQYIEESMGETSLEDLDFDVPQSYLVRGAKLHCDQGSHIRKLNMPLGHGVYITREPTIHQLDCVPGDAHNISSFGVCNSPGIEALSPAPPTVTLELVAYDITGKAVESDEDLGNIKGTACTPQIAGGKWQNTYDPTRIVDNGTHDPSDKLKDNQDPTKGYPSATTDSFLVCACGGIITPITSGQNIELVEFSGSGSLTETAEKAIEAATLGHGVKALASSMA